MARLLAVGTWVGIRVTSTFVDVHVVLHAKERGDRIVTSGPDDLRQVDPSASLIVI